MNIAQNLTLLANTKEEIRLAINNKGGSVESGTPFSGYSEAISSLPSGGPEVLPEGVYAIDITSTGETPASSDIDWYAGFASIQSFDPEGTRYQDRYINVWESAPASTANPDYTIQVNFDTRTHEIGVEHNDAYLYSPLYISYGYAVKEVEDPANSGNTIWLAFFSARETGRYYIQVDGNDHPLIGCNYALPPAEPVNYTYALSMDNGVNFGAGELDGAWDDSIGDWTRSYVDLYYGTGDWKQGNFVSSGTVSPSAYSLENNPDGAGVPDYNVGFDNEQGKWYIQANDNTVNYSDQGEFFCVKATSGNSVDISGATMTVNIGTVDARPEQGGEIPEGLWKFNVTQEGGTNVMWVESFMELGDPIDPVSTVVNIYEDPNGEPINSITYEFTPEFSQEVIRQTNSSAGLYAAENSGAIDAFNDPRTVGISCNTAGTYYIEVVGHTNPRFYDDTKTEIYPNNYVNS